MRIVYIQTQMFIHIVHLDGVVRVQAGSNTSGYMSDSVVRGHHVL